MKSLPDPVDVVKHGMVHVEGRVDRGREQVVGVTADGKVAARMEPEKAVGEAALEFVLEREDAGGGSTDGQVQQVWGGHPGGCGVGAEVPDEAARVVCKTAIGGRHATHGWGNGSEVGCYARYWVTC